MSPRADVALRRKPADGKKTSGGGSDSEKIDDHTRIAREGDVHATYRLIRAGEKLPLDLTVAVFDLCDSTRFRSQYGAREAFARVERLNYIVEHWVRRHGGITVKHLGDGVMASFPPATGIDAGPIRAVRCAEDVIKTLVVPPAKFNYPAAPKITDQMFCKIGIARGPADAIDLNQGDSSHVVDYLGAVLDRAARIAAVCRPNQVLVDDQVQNALPQRGLQESFHIGGPYEVPLKGLGDIKVYDLKVGESGPRPDFNLAAVQKLSSFESIMNSATRLLDASVEDQRLGKPSPDDDPYLMILVDFPAFGSFSFPDQSARYHKLLCRYGRAGGTGAVVTLSRNTADSSSRLQFTKTSFQEACKQPRYRSKLKRFGIGATPDYDALINALLQHDQDALREIRSTGLKVIEMAHDPRIHAWIRGADEAVVSFVMVEKRGQRVVDWSEVGFQTTDRTIVTMLRNYVGTLIEAPL